MISFAQRMKMLMDQMECIEADTVDKVDRRQTKGGYN